jgi:hypothetical protein
MADDWQSCLQKRIAIYQGGKRFRVKAGDKAWLAIAGEWYAVCGEHVDPSRCAGCGKPLSGALEVLRLPYGERCHLDYGCVIIFGRRWKRQSSEALSRLGIVTPPGIVEENGDG